MAKGHQPIAFVVHSPFAFHWRCPRHGDSSREHFAFHSQLASEEWQDLLRVWLFACKPDKPTAKGQLPKAFVVYSSFTFIDNVQGTGIPSREHFAFHSHLGKRGMTDSTSGVRLGVQPEPVVEGLENESCQTFRKLQRASALSNRTLRVLCAYELMITGESRPVSLTPDHARAF
jgi:hypothetical protein